MIDIIHQKLLPLTEPRGIKQDLKCAAVLVPLVKNTELDQWQVIFTRRAEHLKHHPGQISFPGGGFEHHDQDLGVTAIRETHEEIGIKPSQIKLIGRLPQQQTISQYNVTPYVGIVDPDYQLRIDKNEVAEVFTTPFEFVINQANQKKVTQSISGTGYSYYVIQYKDYNIWGATASILVNLSRRLSNLDLF